jgi:hypothetical protein
MKSILFALLIVLTSALSLAQSSNEGVPCAVSLAPMPVVFPGDQVDNYRDLNAFEKRAAARRLAGLISVEYNIPISFFQISDSGKFLMAYSTPVGRDYVTYDFWDINTGTHPFRIKHLTNKSHMAEIFFIGRGVEVKKCDSLELAKELLKKPQRLYTNTGVSLDGRRFEREGLSLRAEENIRLFVLENFGQRKWESLTLKPTDDGTLVVGSGLPRGGSRSSAELYVWDTATGEHRYSVTFSGLSSEGKLFRINEDGSYELAPGDSPYLWSDKEEKLVAQDPNSDLAKLRKVTATIADELKIPRWRFRLLKKPVEGYPKVIFANIDKDVERHYSELETGTFQLWDAESGRLLYTVEYDHWDIKIEKTTYKDGLPTGTEFVDPKSSPLPRMMALGGTGIQRAETSRQIFERPL